MVEMATKLLVNIDLTKGRWSTADGGTGATTNPFSIDHWRPPAQALTTEQ